MAVAGGYTYFIQAGDDGPIKIGRASNVRRRLKELQTASHERLRVLAVIRGDYERSMHRFCSDSRLHGEWFHPTARVWRCIDNFAEPTGGVYDVLLWMRQLVGQYHAASQGMLDLHMTAAAAGHNSALYRQVSDAMGSMEQTIMRIEKCLPPAFHQIEHYEEGTE